MSVIKKNWLSILIIAAASFLLAAHFTFQWYTFYPLAFLIIAIVIGLNSLVDRLISMEVMALICVVIGLVLLLGFSGYDGGEENPTDCPYVPYEVVEGETYAMDVDYDPLYFEDDNNSWIVSFRNFTISILDLNKKEVTHHGINTEVYEGYPRIDSITYYEENIYINGRFVAPVDSSKADTYFVALLDPDNEYAEILFETEYQNQVFNIGGKLHVYINTEYSIEIQEAFADVDDITLHEFEDKIYRVDTFGDIDILQNTEGIFLYHRGEIQQAMTSPNGEYSVVKHIDYLDNEFRISTEDGLFTDIYDESGEYLYTDTSIRNERPSGYVLKLEDHYVSNSVYYPGDLPVMSVSTFMDRNGNKICEQDFSGYDIVRINGELYGASWSSFVKLNELTYSVPIRYTAVRTGVSFWVSTITLLFFVCRKKRIIE